VSSLDKVGFGVPVVSLTQLVYLRFEGRAIEGQRLGPSAAWVRHLVPGLEYAGLRAEDYASISIVVAAVYPQPPEGRVPDFCCSDYDPAFEMSLRNALHGSPWQALLGVVEVREQWRPADRPRVDVAVYGRAKATLVDCERTGLASHRRASPSPIGGS
jgi:hypothetical protein